MRKRTKHVYKVEKKPLTRDDAFPYTLALLLMAMKLILCAIMIRESINLMSNLDADISSAIPSMARIIISLNLLVFATNFAWRMVDMDGRPCIIYLIERTKAAIGLPEVVYGGDDILFTHYDDTLRSASMKDDTEAPEGSNRRRYYRNAAMQEGDKKEASATRENH